MKDNFIFTVDIEAFNDSVVPKDLPIKKKKKKKRCKICRKKKTVLLDLFLCEYCSNTYCMSCKCPFTHKCDNLDAYKEDEKKKLEKKLFSADSNFKKIESI
jgi:hypothetical protein